MICFLSIWDMFLLFFALFAFASALLGVLPLEQHLYDIESGTWHCLLDPSIILDPSQINDDFCDCPDGSDEPATNACLAPGNTTYFFYCENKGFFPRLLERHKLNDGVCDYDLCCDGSDEWSSGKCEDKCAQVMDQYNTHVSSARRKTEEALQVKERLLAEAKKAKVSLETQLAKLRSEISQDESALQALQQKLLEAQKSSEQDNENPVAAELQFYGEKIRNTIDDYKKQLESQKQEILQLQNMLADLTQNYNPNFNDLAVKKCVKLYEDYSSNREEEHSIPPLAVEDHLSQLAQRIPTSQISAQTVVLPTFGNMWHHYYSQLISMFAPEAEKSENAPVRGSSRQAKQIAGEVAKAEKSLNSKKADASILEETVRRSYGENDILRSVEGTWVSRKIGDYTYKIGFLDSVYQDNTLVGRFSGFDSSSLTFSHGSKCWNGPQRSAKVDMVCGPQHVIVSVSEPEKCQYRILLETPLVCSDLSEEELAESFKVDLGKL